MQATPCFEDATTLLVETKSTSKKSVKGDGCWVEGQGMVVKGTFLIAIFFF